MADRTRSPWLPNYTPSDDPDQSAITIKLWEYFSSAAAGVCQLYKSKIDQCADFQCLMDALSPMDQFFRGSQLSIGAATRNGKVMGTRCVRLQLRDLAYASAQTHATENGVEVLVPLDVLLAQELGRRAHTSLGMLGKRRLTCQSRCGRTAYRRCRHKRKRFCQRSPVLSMGPGLNSSQTDYPANHVNGYSSQYIEAPLSSNELEVPSSNPVCLDCEDPRTTHWLKPRGGTRTNRRRRTHDNLAQYSSPLHDCVLSCETDRYRASLSHGSFEMFQDAVHMANLLDPLSKFSVTTEQEDTGEAACKRLRKDSFVNRPINGQPRPD
ncbi:hypothetical protein T265_03072 [Opisthorchis viverrini]|uniref:Uncharacterized protein n=1 Tax=Opisthorchis viverrini TaxID=6198 RepID=A0A074ZSQ7_OPIVI|nr:hypothetical protein T265_03072 [Opisthorchis viverrini]KER30458.1 hypothetical protein T265_03072 [Opisthorchis viverrini]